MQELTKKITQISTSISLLQEFIAAPSVTPCDAGLILTIAQYLEELGFETSWFEENGVRNLIAKQVFSEGPSFAFSGHVDVVPAEQEHWHSDPFKATVVNDVIYGRGVSDMKGGIAAMLSATRVLLASRQKLKGTFYWLLTSDEEGEAEFGTKRIVERLSQDGVTIDACLVGEPTSHNRVGDVIRNGRRGSISGAIKIEGKAGHVAYPEQTVNAAHIAGKVVAILCSLQWQKDQPDVKTTLQVTGVNTTTDVDNIVPEACQVNFNIRYSHGYCNQEIIGIIENHLARFKDNLSLDWSRACNPYYTSADMENSFLNLVENAIVRCTARYPIVNTAGGTSDGRFFANGHTQTIECGVKNDTIHQANECLPISDLLEIEQIYLTVLSDFFGAKQHLNLPAGE
ncbi:succinyl-diaminopimelate desuccinylase [Pseudoalteromonas sp. XMcav11-Q]|uniref:succinyl-diaminopimelate desuccinylase n=1 Tax=Pseudoalteromonas sp. XMcav11-Q TaxID=3136665 RepID=UPI0032C435AF